MGRLLRPELRDLAALPTSWALTIWDALPIFLSIEAALGIAIVVALRGARRHQLWTASALYPIGGLVYAALFDPRLAIVLLAASAASIAIALKQEPASAPDSPVAAVRIRGGDVAWDVARAAAVAALLKVLLTPSIGDGSLFWLPITVAGGLLTPGPVGVAAIPALAVTTASDSVAVGALWLVASVVRPWVWGSVRARRIQ